ncbi:MAG: iron-regulated protein frpC, partial [Pseudomonadota bacterium]
VDTLDFSEASAGIEVDLDAGTVGTAIVENFENVVGTEFNDVIVGDDGANVIEGGSGNNVLTGGAGTDVFSFVDGESGTDTITDFEIGIDQVQLDPAFGLEAGDLPALLTQAGDDVELALGDKTIVIEDALVEEFNADDFLIA